MDGFDDLLAPSRSMLESNPFNEDDNPFGNSHSGSPDPWASPFGPGQDAWGEEQSSRSPQAEENTPESPTTSTSGHISTASPSEELASPRTESAEPSDPLDSAAANVPSSDEEDNKPLAFKRSTDSPLKSPGFRESVDTVAVPKESNKGKEKEEPKVLEKEKDREPVVEKKKDPEPKEPESPKLFSETATIRPSPLEDHEPTADRIFPAPPPTTRTASSFLSNSESSSGGWDSPVSPTQTGWGRHEPFSEPDAHHSHDAGMSASAPTITQTTEDDDSDDDKPIGQLAHSLSVSPKQNQTRSISDRISEAPLFTITVDDPQKVGDPIRSYVMYTVHTRTTSPLFQKSAFSVLRRYSDFLWLYNALSYNNPGVVVPPVPEKNPLLFTNPILGSAGKKGYVGRFDEGFVRQRRFALEKCIQKIANHPILCKDQDLKLFLESDTFALDIKHRKADPNAPGPASGIMSSIGQTLASATGSRFHETDEYFDHKKAYLDALESQLHSLVKAIDHVSKYRVEMAQAVSEFSDRVKETAESGDFNTGLNSPYSQQAQQLAHALTGLGDVERKAQELHILQSEQDMITIMGTVDEYARLIGSVRLAFASRGRMYLAWKSADAEVIRVKQVHDRNRGTSAYGGTPPPNGVGRTGGALGHSLGQIAEAEIRASQAKHAFESTSRLCKSEMARFEEERVDDFKNALHAWLEGMIGRQAELIAAWESYQQGLLRRAGRAPNGQTQSIASQ